MSDCFSLPAADCRAVGIFLRISAIPRRQAGQAGLIGLRLELDR